MILTLWDRIKLNAHSIFSFLALPLLQLILYPFLFLVMGYRLRNLQRLRNEFSSLVRNKSEKPTLICLNHLTYIDSMILSIALIPFWKMYIEYSQMPWHVLELKKLPLLYPFFKALPVERMGDRKNIRRMMDRINYLLQRDDIVVIFPEGTRSITGRVNLDGFQYGVGDILRENPGAQVLCVYLRADRQIAKSLIPPRGSLFDITLKLITPETELQGLRASRDLATQVVSTLDKMEKHYFAQLEPNT